MSNASRVLEKRTRFERLTVSVNGRATECYVGETVATVLLCQAGPVFRRTASGAPRQPVCNMGVCFECVVTIDGLAGVRSCMTPVRAGMCIEVPHEA